MKVEVQFIRDFYIEMKSFTNERYAAYLVDRFNNKDCIGVDFKSLDEVKAAVDANRFTSTLTSKSGGNR